MRYLVKCDDCHETLRETDDVRESYQGGRCEECRTRQSIPPVPRRRRHLLRYDDGTALTDGQRVIRPDDY